MLNLYHVIHNMPTLNQQDMYIEIEDLVRKFVLSGLLRIEAEPKQNFVRYKIPDRELNIVFSRREIYQDDLLEITKKKIYNSLTAQKENLENIVDKKIQKLREQLKKFVEVDEETEFKIARILIQSSHPVIFEMILIENVQVFVTFGQSVGEVMDVISWQEVGQNSGLQSTDGKNVAIFVTCGGNPLALETKRIDQHGSFLVSEDDITTGDGKPALARMMAIAGQEIGHYSDIKRDYKGRQVSRHSANFNATRANEFVNAARKKDIENINVLTKRLNSIGYERLFNLESRLKFFDRNDVKDFSYYIKYYWVKFNRFLFILNLKQIDFWPVEGLNKKKYLALYLNDLFGDMLFNLEPKADVYRNADKGIEEAIACIEALARVPQQVNKWGHRNTIFFWRNLYKFYYYKVIPSLITEYERISGKRFNLYPNRLHKLSFIGKIKLKFYLWFTKKLSF